MKEEKNVRETGSKGNRIDWMKQRTIENGLCVFFYSMICTHRIHTRFSFRSFACYSYLILFIYEMLFRTVQHSQMTDSIYQKYVCVCVSICALSDAKYDLTVVF